jgi:hypothetical protein
MQRSGLATVALQLAVPVALGLLIGGVLAFQAGSSNSAYRLPLGAVPTPSPSWVKPSAASSAASSSAAAATAAAASTTTPAATTTTNGNCGVIVPANPLSTRRLAPPYQLTGEMTSAESACT